MLILTTRYSYIRNRRMFRLRRSKTFTVSDHTIRVPRDYEFDGATVPRIFWPIFTSTGKAFESACLHDWLYDNRGLGKYTRKQVDDIFLMHMAIDKVPTIQRYIFYYSVRFFAKFMWNRLSLPHARQRINQ